MKKIAVVTATRAEYGILFPLIRRIYNDTELELDLIVTGGHLSKQQGYTVDEIKADGFSIAHEIPILDSDNRPYGISLTMANAAAAFAKCFRDDRPDMVVLLGDRTEMLGIAAAAMNEKIPISHIGGGEVTAGAVDDCIRHSLSKMSYLHFTGTELYRRRVIQLGEEPDRVFCVGNLSVENIKGLPFKSEAEIKEELEIPVASAYVVVTFHPVTLENRTAEMQVKELLHAIDEKGEYYYLITKANTDTGGNIINEMLASFVQSHKNARLVSSLGMVRYLSAVKYASFVLGNSSSGISEAPVLGTPTVNVGDRQKGRLMAETVICCEPVREDIVRAINEARKIPHIQSHMFGDGNISGRIVEIIKDFLLNKKINLKKHFYDFKND